MKEPSSKYLVIPGCLAEACAKSAEASAWLAELPAVVTRLQDQWSLTVDCPFDAEASCSWVAPCTRHDGSPAVLKIGRPHMEGAHEIDGLIFWNGDPTVILLESNRELNALLLERCLPGISLCALPEEEQDLVVADMLKRAWRQPSGAAPFHPLADMISVWNRECEAQRKSWPDPGLAIEGARLRKELAEGAADNAALLTDLHAGNVLQSKRMPWLAIDPKPFLGDRAYDATQHLLNCRQRLENDPRASVGRFADLLEIDPQRVRLWLFARLACECDGAYQRLARRVLKG